jgi:vacuolar protein sorting-associated protein 13A/C
MKAIVHVKLKRGSFSLRKSPHSNVKKDLVTLVFDTVTCDIIQYLESLKISAALGDLRLYDGSTKGTLYQKMIGVKNKKQKSRYEAVFIWNVILCWSSNALVNVERLVCEIKKN